MSLVTNTPIGDTITLWIGIDSTGLVVIVVQVFTLIGTVNIVSVVKVVLREDSIHQEL